MMIAAERLMSMVLAIDVAFNIDDTFIGNNRSRSEKLPSKRQLKVLLTMTVRMVFIRWLFEYLIKYY
jgi:hypothetical protein